MWNLRDLIVRWIRDPFPPRGSVFTMIPVGIALGAGTATGYATVTDGPPGVAWGLAALCLAACAIAGVNLLAAEMRAMRVRLLIIEVNTGMVENDEDDDGEDSR